MIPVPITAFVKPPLLKALPSIRVTLSGTSIDVKFDKCAQAELPILVTVFGIIVFLQPAIKVFDAVSITALLLSRESYLTLFESTTIVDRLLSYSKAPLPINKRTFS